MSTEKWGSDVEVERRNRIRLCICLLYTSDAADE